MLLHAYYFDVGVVEQVGQSHQLYRHVVSYLSSKADVQSQPVQVRQVLQAVEQATQKRSLNRAATLREYLTTVESCSAT